MRSATYSEMIQKKVRLYREKNGQTDNNLWI